MKRIDNRTVELTEAEQVVMEWLGSIMALGFDQKQSLQEIIDGVPHGGTTMKILENLEFRHYLAG